MSSVVAIQQHPLRLNNNSHHHHHNNNNNNNNNNHHHHHNNNNTLYDENKQTTNPLINSLLPKKKGAEVGEADAALFQSAVYKSESILQVRSEATEKHARVRLALPLFCCCRCC